MSEETKAVAKRGRPSTKKVDTKKPEEKNTDNNEQEMLKQFENMKKQLELLQKENDSLKVDTKKTEKKHLPKDLEIVVKSNIDGSFGYTNNSTKTSVFVRFDEMEDEDIMTLEEIRVFNNLTKYLKKGKIAIYDVIDEDYEIEDVVKYLKLNKIYESDTIIAPNKIRDIFTDEYSAKEFDQFLLSSKELGEAILEVALTMKKTGELNDNAKISLLKQRTRNKALFN